MRVCLGVLTIYGYMILGSTSSAQLMGDWPLLPCQVPKLREEASDRITVRAWPVAASSRRIPMAGTTLQDALAEPNLDSLPIAILYQQIRDNAGNPAPVPTDGASVAFRTGTTNVVIIGRGNNVIVFPRMLMLHPAFQSIRIRGGDFIGTIMATTGQGQIDDTVQLRLDPLRRFLPRYQKVQNPDLPEFTIGGSLLPRATGHHSSTVRSISHAINLTLENQGLGDRENDFEAATLVSVLTRHIGGTKITYVCPLRKLGIFRDEGSVLSKLSEPPQTKVEAKELWEYHCGRSILSGELKDGDLLEITFAEEFLVKSGFSR